jgi:hypothetical protein
VRGKFHSMKIAKQITKSPRVFMSLDDRSEQIRHVIRDFSVFEHIPGTHFNREERET